MKKLLLLAIILTASAAAFAQKGRVYDKFPEDFEMPDTSAKAKYKKGDIQLKTGNWTFDQAILGAVDNRDRFNGKQSVRIHQDKENSGYLQMNFDLPNGASKVTFVYGVYYKDSPSIIKLEYSTDKGQTWKQAGKDITDASAKQKTADFKLDIKEPVRFRINKLNIEAAKKESGVRDGRLSVDDFTVVQN
ncbi:MAG: hypothetical protein EOO98_02405 [Pedobacter sp.]|nr:MAG: hypothetical protein EOO98_02405 [Pedobacter sp.]